jgi:hypothetical protein
MSIGIKINGKAKKVKIENNTFVDLDTAIETEELKESEIINNLIINKTDRKINLLVWGSGIIGTIIAGLILYYVFKIG